MKRYFSLPAIFALLLLFSCRSGLEPANSRVQIPQNFSAETMIAQNADSLANLTWFELFDDDALNTLLNKALSGNLNLKNAQLRIEQAEAFLGQAKASQLPSIGYQASASFNNPVPDQHLLAGTLSWEIDFWGRLRHARMAANYDLMASAESKKALATTVASGIASLYFQLRDLDNRIHIAENTARLRSDYYTVINDRFLGGEVAELDVLQASQQVQYAAATLASLTRQRGITERSIAILTGESWSPIPRGLTNDQQTLPLMIPVGLPSTLLERRPDLLAAHYNYEAAVSRVSQASAQRLPTLRLTGMLGLSSPEISNLLASGSAYNSISGALLGPVFEFGKNKRRVDVQIKEAEIAANTYAFSYINALAEVENALNSIESLNREYQAISTIAENATKALALSQARYDNGYTDYTEVLIAEQAFFENRLQQSITRFQLLNTYIDLFKALGGGW